MIEAKEPQAEQSTPYTPAGPADPLIFEAFEGINTATLRPGVDDKQAAWLDGFMPLGPGRNLRTMYGLSAPLYTAPGTLAVAFFDFGNIGSTPYMAAVLSDGSIAPFFTRPICTGFAVVTFATMLMYVPACNALVRRGLACAKSFVGVRQV